MSDAPPSPDEQRPELEGSTETGGDAHEEIDVAAWAWGLATSSTIGRLCMSLLTFDGQVIQEAAPSPGVPREKWRSFLRESLQDAIEPILIQSLHMLKQRPPKELWQYLPAEEIERVRGDVIETLRKKEDDFRIEALRRREKNLHDGGAR